MYHCTDPTAVSLTDIVCQILQDYTLTVRHLARTAGVVRSICDCEVTLVASSCCREGGSNSVAAFAGRGRTLVVGVTITVHSWHTCTHVYEVLGSGPRWCVGHFCAGLYPDIQHITSRRASP